LWLRSSFAFASTWLGRVVAALAVSALPVLAACHLVILLPPARQLRRVCAHQCWSLLWVACAAAAAVGGVPLAVSGTVCCSSTAPPLLSPCCAVLLPPRARQLFRHAEFVLAREWGREGKERWSGEGKHTTALRQQQLVSCDL